MKRKIVHTFRLETNDRITNKGSAKEELSATTCLRPGMGQEGYSACAGRPAAIVRQRFRNLLASTIVDSGMAG